MTETIGLSPQAALKNLVASRIWMMGEAEYSSKDTKQSLNQTSVLMFNGVDQ